MVSNQSLAESKWESSWRLSVILPLHRFFANSLALPTNHSIIILGGFDLNFKGSNKIL